MRRGELWTAVGPGYAGKPRPVLVLQSDFFTDTDSVTVCLLTTDRTDFPILRIEVDPSAGNGLRETSFLMVDKLMTTRRRQLGEHIGRLEAEHLLSLERSLVVFLGLG